MRPKVLLVAVALGATAQAVSASLTLHAAEDDAVPSARHFAQPAGGAAADHGCPRKGVVAVPGQRTAGGVSVAHEGVLQR